MPVHDWTRVDAGIFHAMHHGWIEEIARSLNHGVLPNDYYALPEQHAVGFGPDVLTLERNGDNDDHVGGYSKSNGGLMLAPPKLQPVAETDLAFYRRKQKTVTVRHVSGDRIVAVIEIVSPGNKASRSTLRAFVSKAGEFLERQIHLLILDLFPPGPRDPRGIHAAIWEEVAGEEYEMPAEKPFTLAAYESGLSLRAYVVHIGLNDPLPEMPLFLEPERAVEAPLEATYQAAFTQLPDRWRRVLESPVAEAN
jgi:hypothetical protein